MLGGISVGGRPCSLSGLVALRVAEEALAWGPPSTFLLLILAFPASLRAFRSGLRHRSRGARFGLAVFLLLKLLLCALSASQHAHDSHIPSVVSTLCNVRHAYVSSGCRKASHSVGENRTCRSVAVSKRYETAPILLKKKS